MKFRLLFIAVLCLGVVKSALAQDVTTKDINQFIKAHSEQQTLGKSKYWAYIKIKNDQLIIHNRPMNIGRFTFPIDKIDIDKTEARKDRIRLHANAPGLHVTRRFGKQDKQFERATILFEGMKKDKRKELRSMVVELLKAQSTPKATASAMASQLDTASIQTINRMIITHFMNYELSERNGNLSTIYSYVPEFSHNTIKQVGTSSNLGGHNEIANFWFNPDGKLSRVHYQVDRGEPKGPILFKYDLIYDGPKVTSIHVKGKEKYRLAYNGDVLSSITTSRRGVFKTYNITYSKNRADLKSDVRRDGKVYRFTNKDHGDISREFIEWNDALQLTAYELGYHEGKDITYNARGDQSSLVFVNVRSGNNQASWTYTFDGQDNWLTRENKEIKVLRVITYR